MSAVVTRGYGFTVPLIVTAGYVFSTSPAVTISQGGHFAVTGGRKRKKKIPPRDEWPVRPPVEDWPGMIWPTERPAAPPKVPLELEPETMPGSETGVEMPRIMMDTRAMAASMAAAEWDHSIREEAAARRVIAEKRRQTRNAEIGQLLHRQYIGMVLEERLREWDDEETLLLLGAFE